MKLSTTILLITVLVTTPALFSHAHAEALIGVKGGLTVSNWWGSDAGGPDMKAGFVGGAFFAYMTHDKFSFLSFKNIGIQSELLFHRKGVKEVYYDVGISWDLDYLEIPLLVKAEIPPLSKISKGYLLIGPAFAFTLSSKMKAEYLGESAEEDVGDITSNMDIGLVLGLSVNFDIASTVLVLDLRYTLGMMTIDEGGGAEVRNGALSFTAGMGLPFGSTE